MGYALQEHAEDLAFIAQDRSDPTEQKAIDLCETMGAIISECAFLTPAVVSEVASEAVGGEKNVVVREVNSKFPVSKD